MHTGELLATVKLRLLWPMHGSCLGGSMQLPGQLGRCVCRAVHQMCLVCVAASHSDVAGGIQQPLELPPEAQAACRLLIAACHLQGTVSRCGGCLKRASCGLAQGRQC